MIPLGYLKKHIVSRPEWLHAPSVIDIYSSAGCTSKKMDFNPYAIGVTSMGLLESTAVADTVCEREADDIDDYTLFYYEGYDQEYDEKGHIWIPCVYGALDVQILTPSPIALIFHGYDIVEFDGQPGCSVLSCNSAAERTTTNEHCLVESLEDAITAIESGAIQPAEPGPYRIIAVYTLTNAA